MNPKLVKPWIPADRIEAFVQVEPAFFLLGLVLAAWGFYKIFLRKLTPERHRNLRGQFKTVLFYLVLAATSFSAYQLMLQSHELLSATVQRLTPYVGLAALVFGLITLIRTCRIIMFEYLFLSHMKVGVPLLLVNIFTLVLTAALLVWVGGEVFGVSLAPLLATSAALSLVLGLALQDTLGNLFAGLALQFDKPYELGDWVEVAHEGQRWLGQVMEMSWRATVLVSVTDELITIPNRVVSSGQVINYAARIRPLTRGLEFRIPFGSDLEKVKATLTRAALEVVRVRRFPEPRALIKEPTDSWIPVRLIYCIDDFGAQIFIADEVLKHAINALKDAGIETAPSRLHVLRAENNPASAQRG